MDLADVTEHRQRILPNLLVNSVHIQLALWGPRTFSKMNHISDISKVYIWIGIEWTLSHLWNFLLTSNLNFVKWFLYSFEFNFALFSCFMFKNEIILSIFSFHLMISRKFFSKLQNLFSEYAPSSNLIMHIKSHKLLF